VQFGNAFFFSKTNVMIIFLHNSALFFSPIFSPIFMAKTYIFLNHNIGPWLSQMRDVILFSTLYIYAVPTSSANAKDDRIITNVRRLLIMYTRCPGANPTNYEFRTTTPAL
jgi:hypothetical protein